MNWENVTYSIIMFILILFLNPYLNRMSFWINILFIVILIVGVDFTLSKVRFLQAPVTKIVGWSIVIAVIIFVGALHHFIRVGAV